MPNWLQQFLPPSSSANTKLPVVSQQRRAAPTVTNRSLPPASVIYGIAAAALFAVAICFLMSGSWLTGLLVLLPAAGFLGFSLYFLKIGS